MVRGLLKLGCVMLVLLSGKVAARHLDHEVPYYPKDFYKAVDTGLRGTELKSTLNEILSSWHKTQAGESDQILKSCSHGDCYRHESLGYRRARQILFGELHLERTGDEYFISDVYCERRLSRKDFRSQPPGPGQIPDPNLLNAEHTWPQSRFAQNYPEELQKSDLHILYPALSTANSTRSNIEFAEVVTPIASPCSKSQRGYSEDGSRQQYFEVPEAHKGNVARAIFYFATRYRLRVAPHEETSLRAWHQADPVDEKEQARNRAIFEKQKVRNPFIDHPELVELISDF